MTISLFRRTLLGSVLVLGAPVVAQTQPEPAERRVATLNDQLTTEERLTLVNGSLGVGIPGMDIPKEAIGSAGYVAGVPRLGIPALQETDAALGITNPLRVRAGDRSTALPSVLAMGATWNTELAYRGGAMVAREARAKGFNVLLGGGVNLVREPRGGRNFEYVGEDPWLTGMMGGAQIRGSTDSHVIATIKHFALNAQETGRFVLDARIDEAALRESDLLAFKIAIERGRPTAVICGLNRVNGPFGCGHDWLLNHVLKGEWRFPGFVMSDWGAVHGADSALAGLDQESGSQLDQLNTGQVYFRGPLEAKLASDPRYAVRLKDMTRRILRAMILSGVMDDPPHPAPIDFAAHAAITKAQADEGIVLLKNDGHVLPIAATARRIVVIGGHADAGVLSGGGSSQVVPADPHVAIPMGGSTSLDALNRQAIFHPSAPLAALRARFPDAEISYQDGRYPGAAAAAARQADIAIVFATQWMLENEDAADLSLPEGQDATIAAVAAANPRTVVVLETGGAVLMPWLARVPAVLSAWYPGERGGEAIADILAGATNPSGHLPISFPASEIQGPASTLRGLDLPAKQTFDVRYDEGADVGYRWYARHGQKPLFAFGHGLSYTAFAYDDLRVTGGRKPTLSFVVRNTGGRQGKAVPQAYLTAINGNPERRLIGWDKVALAPGEAKRVTLAIDPVLLAHFDVPRGRWRVAGGRYAIAIATSADTPVLDGTLRVARQSIRP